MKPKKLFSDFPEAIYVVHHEEDDDDEGYYLLFDNEVEAAEDAEGNDSQVAFYEIVNVEPLTVVKTVERI